MKRLCSLLLAGILVSAPLNAKAEENIPVYTSEKICSLSNDEFDMIAKVVYAESGNQEWEAQWMVACVILNRVESDSFPDTVKDVIFQDNPKQFCCAWDGGYDKAMPGDATNEAVAYALEQERIPADILFFTSNGYLKGTEPYEKVDDMYFSR